MEECASGTFSNLSGASLGVSVGSTLRTVAYGTDLLVYLNNSRVVTETIASTAGEAGIGGYGMSGGSGFPTLEIGHHDRVAKNWTGPGGFTYAYPASANNGQITQVADSISGETVTYAYDALKRRTSASSTASWTQTFQYDGFGNLTAKVLNGTTTPIAVTAATNRLTYSTYDANGNMLTGVGATLTYDEKNRLASAMPTSGGTAYLCAGQ